MSNYDLELEKLRKEIDKADDAICNALLIRKELITEIALLKKKYGVTEMSESRRKEIMERLTEWSISNFFPTYVLKEIYDIIFENSILRQEVILLRIDSTSNADMNIGIPASNTEQK